MCLYLVPSDEQLVNFAAVFVSKEMGSMADKETIRLMFESHPDVKREWLDRHRALQEAISALSG